MVKTGINGRLANRRATVAQERVIRRPCPAAELTGRQAGRTSDFIDVTAAGTFDVNLTGAGCAERETNWRRRATNHTSVMLVMLGYTQRIGLAADDVLTHSGPMYEKLRYVDV